MAADLNNDKDLIDFKASVEKKDKEEHSQKTMGLHQPFLCIDRIIIYLGFVITFLLGVLMFSISCGLILWDDSWRWFIAMFIILNIFGAGVKFILKEAFESLDSEYLTSRNSR